MAAPVMRGSGGVGGQGVVFWAALDMLVCDGASISSKPTNPVHSAMANQRLIRIVIAPNPF
jgi:hypothetical protein